VTKGAEWRSRANPWANGVVVASPVVEFVVVAAHLVAELRIRNATREN
jgi:hypothetical protein